MIYDIHDIPGTCVLSSVSSLFWCGFLPKPKTDRSNGPVSPKTNRTGSFRFHVSRLRIPSWSFTQNRANNSQIYIYIHICLCNKYVTIYSMCIYIYIRCTEWFWPTPGEFIESAFCGPWTSIENSRSHSPIQRGIMVISRTNLTFPKTKIAPSQKEVKDPLPLPPLVWRV